MVKFAHLLVLSALIVWLAGSGCVGNSTSEVERVRSRLKRCSRQGMGHQLKIWKWDLHRQKSRSLILIWQSLEDLLENASPEEEIEIEEL